MSVAWPGLKEEIINETEFYSDLDPHGAPRWWVSVSFMPGVDLYLRKFFFLHTKRKGLLFNCLFYFEASLDSTLKRILELCESSKATSRIDYYVGKSSDETPDRAFRALTKGHYVNPTQVNFITNPTGVSPGASVNMPLSDVS